MLKIFEVKTDGELETVKELFIEYADFLPFDLNFQNFKEELNNLPGKYSPPKGCLLLAEYKDQLAGCVGLQELSDGVCEMRKLFVRPNFQRLGIGKTLCKTVIQRAGEIGYTCMRLCTALEPAKKLYRSIGFEEIKPYKHVPIATAVFMELKLD